MTQALDADLPLDPQLRRLLREVAYAPKGEILQREASLIGSTIGAYRVLAPLGRGGSGVVFRAHDPRLDREVALKLLAAERDEQVLGEARILARARHPSVPVVYEVGSWEEGAFIAMELVNGTSLRSVLEAGEVAWERGKRWLTEIADALAHLHRIGIVHRDLKPENVVIDDADRARLLDFGISAPTAVEPSTIGVAGTRGYAPPEQLSGDAPDPRMDIHAFGVLARELIHRARGEGEAWSALAGACAARESSSRPGDALSVLARIRAIESRSRPRSYALAALPAIALLSLGALWGLREGSAPYRVSPIIKQSKEAPLHDAVISPDGRTLAYIESDRVLLRDLDSGLVHPLEGIAKSDRTSCLSWSADGQSVLFSLNKHMVRVAIDGGAPVELPQTECALISPDGRWLSEARNFKPIVRPAPGGEALRLALDDGEMDTSMDWSAQNSRLLLGTVSFSAGARIARLQVFDPRSLELTLAFTDRRLLGSSGGMGAAWISEDDIAYALHPRDGSPGLEIRKRRFGSDLADPGREIARVPDIAAAHLSASRGGERLVLFGFESQADIWEARIDEGKPELHQVTFSAESEIPASYADQGRSLWMTTQTPRGRSAVALEIATGRTKSLALTAPGWVTHPVPADLEGGLLYWSIEQEPPRAKLHHRAPNGTERTIFEAPVAVEVAGAQRPPPFDHQVRCATRSARCFLLERRDRTAVIYEIDLASGSIAERGRIVLPLVPDYGFALSPDGERLAIADVTAKAVHVFRASGETIVDIQTRSFIPQYLTWEGDRDAIIASGYGASAMDADDYRLMRVHLDGRIDVLWVTTAGWLLSPVVSPDGQRIAVGMMSTAGSAWLIERTTAH
jgi:serine/threonine protein kinase